MTTYVDEPVLIYSASFSGVPEITLYGTMRLIQIAWGQFFVPLATPFSSFTLNLIPTGVEENQMQIPTRFALEQNYPNPFNPSTTISFDLPKQSFVSLKVFDLIGREVATVVCEELQGGNYTRQWNAANVSSGVYFYRLQAGTFTETKKLILLK
jgi:hypothetical protein